MTRTHYGLRSIATLTTVFLVGLAFALHAPAQPTEPATSRPQSEPTTIPATQPVTEGTETLVFLRHGEKPPGGLGQLTPKGLNRALALSEVLPKKFGKPDYIFAPDPHQEVKDRAGYFYYCRPLATIEPTAIRLEMPVQTPFGFQEIEQLDTELTRPKYANARVFIAWEHIFEQRAVANLIAHFGGDPRSVPQWKGTDYDSLYVVTIHHSPDHPPTATFKLEHEDLNGQSDSMPDPAGKH